MVRQGSRCTLCSPRQNSVCRHPHRIDRLRRDVKMPRLHNFPIQMLVLRRFERPRRLGGCLAGWLPGQRWQRHPSRRPSRHFREGGNPVHIPIFRIDPRYFHATEVETLLGESSNAKTKLG